MTISTTFMKIFIIVALLITSAIRLFICRGKAPYSFDKDATAPLRVVLALLVMVTHTDVLTPLHLGTFAVSIFFFLSGYGMEKSYQAKGKVYLQGFLKAHFLKLFLPLMLSSVLWALRFRIADLLGHGDFGWGDFLMTSTFWGPYSWFPRALFFVSIAFYLAYRFNCRVLIPLGAVAYYVHSRYWTGCGSWEWAPIWGVLIGFACAAYEEKLRSAVSRFGGLLPIGVLVLYVICKVPAIFFGGALPVVSATEVDYFFTGLAVLLFFYTVRIPTSRSVTFLGSISYEIYLYHGLVYHLLARGGVNPYLAAILMVAITIPVSYWSKRILKGVGK